MEIEFNNMQLDLLPVGFLAIFIFTYFQFRQKRKWPLIVCLFIFSVYILFSVKETFFPLWINGTYAETMRSIPITSHMNLLPFYVGQTEYLSQRTLFDFGKNILLTIPFGIVFITKVKAKDFLWLPFAVGFGIEFSQLLISLLLGYPYRVIDINDALFNAFGVIVGYGLFRLFGQLFTLFSKQFDLSKADWGAFIQEVILRT